VYYRVYGLTLSSTLRFPELTPGAARRPALTFRASAERFDPRGWRSGPARLLPDGRPSLTVAARAGAYALRFPNRADFVLDPQGRSIIGYRGGRTALGAFRHLLLDQVLPLVLSHRGTTVLHASGFACHAGAVALIGATGVGKSTLAASFGADGWPLIADDAVVLRQQRGVVSTIPAYPGLRVWPDALAAVGLERGATRLSRDSNKRRIAGSGGAVVFLRRTAPLRRVYLLDPARRGASLQPRIEPLSRRESVIELIKHSYVMDVTDGAKLAGHLDRLTRECAPLGVRRITYPRRFLALPAVRAAILDDLGIG
jgi:hypothetical protein